MKLYFEKQGCRELIGESDDDNIIDGMVRADVKQRDYSPNHYRYWGEDDTETLIEFGADDARYVISEV